MHNCLYILILGKKNKEKERIEEKKSLIQKRISKTVCAQNCGRIPYPYISVKNFIIIINDILHTQFILKLNCEIYLLFLLISYLDVSNLARSNIH